MRKFNEKIFTEFIETEDGKKYLSEFNARAISKVRAMIDETKEKD